MSLTYSEVALIAACTLMIVFLIGLILWACGILDIEFNLGEGCGVEAMSSGTTKDEGDKNGR